MEKEQVKLIFDSQKDFFASGRTLDVKFRISVLKKLRSLIIERERDIVDALWNDFRKPEFEVIATETRFAIKELNHAIRRLKGWSRPKMVHTPLVHFLSWSYIVPQPYGQVLVMSAWNYPFQLSFVPMIGALTAGNCVILKVSRQVPHIARVMEEILSNFPQELVAIIDGDHSISEFLFDQKFDYIFFTGSQKIGRYVMQKAAANLIPVSLELGGKNPCVVADDARLDYAARRIAWGKWMNCGQTCVGADYVLVDRKVRDKFIELISAEIKNFYGDDPEQSNDYARVISSANVDRLQGYLKFGSVATGGAVDGPARYVAPTILKDVSPDDPIMKEEIFGPLLPVLDYDDFEEVYGMIERNPKPLATYIFSTSRKRIREFMLRTRSGNACVNDTVVQIASPYLPYGGVGSSGIGRYHGRKSFETFSNMRSVLQKSNLMDIWLRYPPYSSLKTRIVSFLMR